MDKPIYLSFSASELNKKLMYETNYDKLQPCFGRENLKIHYVDCDSFVLSTETHFILNDWTNIEDLFDFSDLNENHELFSNKNEKNVGKFKIETPENIWIDDFVCLRSKAYSFKCGNKNTNKLKGISKPYSKNIKFDENRFCLDEGEYQKECLV